ncbi:MAG: lysostaphin resistance A-like protein [Salibacteraceae bacterium]
MSLKNNWVNASPFGKLVLLGFLMVLGTLIGLGLFYLCNEFTWGYSIHELSYLTIKTDSEIVLAAKFLQMFSQVGLFLLPAFLFAYLISNHPISALNIAKAPNLRSILIVLIVTLLSIPFINYLAIWNAEIHLPSFLGFAEEWMRSMQRKNDLLMEVVLQMNSSQDILINIVMMTLLPAIGEELIFRGIIQKQLIKWFSNPHMAILITSIIFSAFHLQFLGFFSRLLLGMIFGYFYFYSKNLWTAIWAHFINNGLALSLAVIYGSELDSAVMEQEPTFTVFLGSLIAFAFGLWLLYQQREKMING